MLLQELEQLEKLDKKTLKSRHLPFEIVASGLTGSIKLVPKPSDFSFIDVIDNPFEEIPISILDPASSDIATGTSPSVLKAELEEKYLKPKRLDIRKQWLDQCQQKIPRTGTYSPFFHYDVQPPRRKIEVIRKGIDGDQISWEEVKSLQKRNLTAKTSTSMQREMGSTSAFIKGSNSFVPFAPGGLESFETVDQPRAGLEALSLTEKDLKKVPPGFNRGLFIREETESYSSITFEDILAQGLEDDAESSNDDDLNETETEMKESGDSFKATTEESETVNIDDLLPDKTPEFYSLKPKTAAEREKEWAHMVDVNQEMSNFNTLVPELAFKYPFELDTFQKQAIYHLENGDSVFVAAHTSAGKTVVAEYAIALATKHMTKAIYTSPIKALSNQKFRDFRNTFEDVGILTGDVQINPEGSCLIMTTEILRSMLYKGADLIRDVEFVIFDEVHYVNDQERGVVWEEVIIMLPAHVSVILLSATVPNTKEFADWVGRTKKRDIFVINTLKRPVPLEHYLYTPKAHKDLFKIVDSQKNFLPIAYRKAQEASSGMSKEKTLPSNRGDRGRGGRGRGAPPPVSRNFKVPTEKSSRNLYSHLIAMMKNKGLLPTVVFTFSKRRCEEYANNLSGLDLTSAAEKSQIHVFFERALTRLKGDDKELPQILRARETCSRGIAVHHGGLLPIMKETVEMLFGKGLCKVLFATETFAMGVNMPARAVVFSSLRKHDGRNFRDLLPGEYTQMSGRAGRRGLDDTGVVIIACSDELPEVTQLNSIILGTPTKLQSQFRLTYNMILNLLRVEALRVEEMIKRSFSENTSQKALPEQQKLLTEKEKDLGTLPSLSCNICAVDINQYYDCCGRIIELNRHMLEKIVLSSLGPKALAQGRLIVIHNAKFGNTVAVIIKPVIYGAEKASFKPLRMYQCAILVESTETFNNGAPGLSIQSPVNTIHLPRKAKLMMSEIAYTDIVLVTRHCIKVDQDGITDLSSPDSNRLLESMVRKAEEISEGLVPEYDWTKLKELEFQEHWHEKSTLMKDLLYYHCVKCPDLNLHYAIIHGQKHLQRQLDDLKWLLSDQNLELLPEYEQRVVILKNMKFIDENSTVQLKGRVACEINSVDSLLLTELILDNFFSKFEPAEIASLLSCFVFQEKSDNEPNLPHRLEEGLKEMKTYAFKVGEIQKECGLDIQIEDYVATVNQKLMEVVYEWARDHPFKYITGLTDVLEGSIVRCITRLDETCRDVRNAARIVGDYSLYKKMEEASALIKRDIVFAASLYF